MNAKKFLKSILRFAPALPPEELLQKIAFQHNGKTDWHESNDCNADFREEVVELLFAQFEAAHRQLIRFLLKAEITYCGRMSTSTEALRQLTFMLFVLGENEDIALLYEAKFQTSFDASISLDWELILGRDKEAVRAYYAQQGRADIVAALAESDEYELRTPDEFMQSMREYFGVAE